MPTPILRKYGVETTINFELYELDGTDLKTDAAYAEGDVKIMKDEGDEANTTNGFTDEGSTYSHVLTATEMQAARITLIYIDQTNPKAWHDRVIHIDTYGNASAMHAFDLDTATQNVNVASTSDIDFSATQKTSLETAVDNSLDNAVPASPTANSINERVKALDDLISDSKLPAQVKGQDNIDFGALQKASLNAATPAVTVSDKTGFSLAANQAGVTIGTVTTLTNKTGFALSAAGVDAILDETLTAHATADSLGMAVKNVLKTKKNKQAIVGTQLIIYDDDGTTPLYTFNLDSATAPTSRTPA